MNETWDDIIRRAIDESDLSLYAIANAADVDYAPLWRFKRGDQTMTLTLAQKVGAVVGVEMRIKAKRTSPKGTTRKPRKTKAE